MHKRRIVSRRLEVPTMANSIYMTDRGVVVRGMVDVDWAIVGRIIDIMVVINRNMVHSIGTIRDI